MIECVMLMDRKGGGLAGGGWQRSGGSECYNIQIKLTFDGQF